MTRSLRPCLYGVIFLAVWLLRPSPVFAQCAFTNLNTNYCSDDAPFVLTGATAYFGTGVNGSTFTPGNAVGTNVLTAITYTLDNTAANFSPIAGTGTAVTLADEAVSAAITIGFTFRFYATGYTSVRIGSNGILGFVNTALTSSANQTLPDATTPNSIIAAAWDDLDPSLGGTIDWFLTGTGTNRRFVVNYKNVVQKSTGIPITVQVQLHETTNKIEIHTTSADFSTSPATQGIESILSGSSAFASPVAGRNNTTWTATNDYVGFTPCRTTQSVTVSAVPASNLNVVPANTTICAGSTVAVTIGTTTSTVLYQLQDANTSAILSGFFYGTSGNLVITSNAITANTVIRVLARNASNGCMAYLANTVNVTVNTPPVPAAGADQSVCGLTATLAATAPAPGSGVWTKVSGPGNIAFGTASLATSSATADAYGAYVLRWTVTNGVCPSAADDVQITYQPAPSIATQPTATAVCEGATATFSVTAGGPGLTYQWQVDTGSGFGDIAGAVGNTLSLPNVTSAMSANQYRVHVSGTCGPVATSAAVLLTVYEQPEIITQPLSSIVCETGNTTFTIDAGVTTAATYQWQVSTNGGTSFTAVANGGIYTGATTNTLSLNTIPLANNGYIYRAIVSGTCSPAITSDGGLLTVQQSPVITAQPAGVVACEGNTVTFNVTATGTGLTYQWKKGGTDIGGATASSLTLPAISAAEAGSYTVLVKGTCNTTGVLSTAASLTVNEQPEVTGQPLNRIICEGANTSFIVNAGVTTGATYQWQISTNGGASYTTLNNGGIYTGATTNTLVLTGVSLTDNGYLYRALVGGTCTPPVVSDGALLTVQQSPVITGQPVARIACEGSAVTFTVNATGTGLTYQWKKGGTDIGGATASSFTLPAISAADAGNYTVLVKGACNTTGVLSTAASLNVNEQPEVTSQPGNSTICEGGNTSFTVNAGVTTGATYQWQVSTNGGASYTAVTNGGIYTGATTNTLTLTGAPLTNNGYVYNVLVGGTCTPGVVSNGGLLTVQQSPIITTQPLTQVACEGNTITFSVVASGTGLTYQWKKGGTDIGGATGASLTLPAISASDAGSYTVLVKGTCNTTGVFSTAASLTVNEQPEVTSQPGNSIICEGGNTSFTVSAGVTTGATYQWQVSTNGGTSYTTVTNGGIYAGATTNTLTLNTAPLGNNGYLYRAAVAGTCNPGVTSEAGLLTVQQAPVITLQPATQVVCEGSAVTLRVTAVGTGLTYQWKKDGTDIGSATASTLILASVNASDAASYTVLVKGTCNTTGVLSAAATLTVNEQPEIITPPASQVVCETGNVSFTVDAGVTTGATYQWQVSTNNGSSYSNISNGGIYAGATGAALSITSAPLANNGFVYRVLVGGSCSPAIASDGGVLTVQQSPVITGQPSGQIVCEGSTVTFNVTAAGTGLTYQWRKGGVDISGATASALVLPSVSAADAANYTVLIKGTCNATGVLSTAAALVVNEQPEITGQPANQVICETGNTSFTVNAGVTTAATYQWQLSTNGGTSYSNISNGGIYTGATSNTLALTAAPLSNNGYLYRAIVGGTCGPNVISDGALLTVQQAPVITGQPAAQVVCEGSTVTFIVAASGAGLTYQWKKGGTDIAGATAASLVLPTVSAVDAGSYTVLVKGTCNTTGVLSTAATLTVNEQPEIINQPLGQVICETGNTSFTVNAGITTAATYQWQVSTNGGASYTNISIGGIYSGITSSILNLNAVPLANNGELYRVIVGGTCGPNVISNGALLTVQQAPVINSQPAAQVVCEGSAVTFSVTAAGTGLTYQWKKGGTDISGATASTLVLSSVSASDAANYTVLVKGTCNTTGVLSTAASLTVNEQPEITAQPLNSIICETGNTSFTVNAGITTAATYQWQVSTNGGTSYSNLGNTGIYTGTTTGTLSLNAVPLGNNGYLYRVVVGGTCNPNVTSEGGLLTVQQAPVITGQPATQVVCEGSIVTFTVAATGTGLTYQWQKGGADISGATAASLVLPSVTTADAGNYTVLVKGTCNTTGVPSAIASLTVNRIPNATATDAAICSGSATSVAITNPNTVPGTTFSWTIQNSSNVTGASAGSGTVITQTLVVTDGHTNGLVTYLIQPVAAGCAGPAYAVQIAVRPIPTASASPQTICSGTSTSVAISNPNAVAGTTFSWTVLSATNVNGAAAGNGSTIGQVLTSANGVTAGAVTYRITPVAGGCAGTPVDVTVTASPVPVVTSAPSALIAEICSGTVLNFQPTSTLSGTTYAWTSSVIGTLSGVSPSGTGPVNDTPVNGTNTNAVIIYTITPSYGGCAGAPVNYVVTVRPVPTAATSGVTSICSGSQTAIAISNPNAVAGTTFSWAVQSTTNVTGAAGGTGNAISQVLTSTDGINAGTVVYRITPSANGCAGTPVDVTITVKPVPVITNGSSDLAVQICSGAALNFTPTTSIAGTTFTWTSSITGPISAASVSASGAGAITNAPVNTGNVNGIVAYRITPQINGCAGAYIDYIVTVKPVPTASATDVTLCSGQTAVIAIQASPAFVSGTTFTWTAAASANVSGAANGNGSTISQLLTTTNALAGSVTYSITPAASGCNGAVTTVVANVNPIATVNAGADYSVCEPVTIPLSGVLGGSATAGVWTINTGTGTLSPTTITGTTATAVYTVGAGDIGGAVTLVLTASDPDGAGPCSSVSDQLVINVNRKARVTAPADYTVCEPASIALTGTLSGSSVTGLWSLQSGNGSLSATSVTGLTVTANYGVAAADVTQTLRFRLTTNDPDGFGPCVAEYDEVDIHINESAKVNAGVDKAVCEDKLVNLEGSFTSPTTSVTWTGGSGAGQFSNVTDPVATYTLTAGDIASGGITFTLSTNDPDGAGPCGIVSDQVYIKINKLPEVGLSNLKGSYAENSPVELLDGFPTGGFFTGPGIVAGTNQFDPGNAPFGTVVITYTYTAPETGCENSASRTTVVNPVTDIDFDIAPIRRDVNGFPIICANSGNLKLIGYPPYNDPSAATAFFRSDDITQRIGFDGNDYIIKTDGLAAGVYEVQYVYENILGARDTLTKSVTVYSGPKAVISVDRVCKDEPLTFLESSFMPVGDLGHIVKYYWAYGEFGAGNGDGGSPRNPTYTYQMSGNKTVTLRVETDQGCSHDTTAVVRVGVKPEVAFDWKKICSGIETTEFQDRSVTTEFSEIKEYKWDFGDGYGIPFGATGATIPNGTNDGSTSGTYNNPDHTYSLFKVYNVTLTVNTVENCTTSKTSRVYILDYNIPGPTQGYFTNFENGSGTWVQMASETSDTSWVFGPMDPTQVINKAASGVNAWWTGGNPDAATDFSTYYKNEDSGVIGPCLNLENLKRPMLSLNYWSDMQAGFDGAVIQYSTDGGLSWETVGNAEGDGIAWYNARDLQSNPGGQDNYAWSGATSGWKNARFNLDQIPESKRNLVVFRIAFASNSDNPTGTVLNGFAFDDIYIGEKKRNVLVEQFTNDSYGPSNQADAYFDDLFTKQFEAKDSSDFIAMQYHIATPAFDQLNADNPADPNARSLLYGVSQPPTAFMDGIQGAYENSIFDGAYNKINADEVDRRALADPLFGIKVEFLPTDDAHFLKGNVTYTYIDSVRAWSSPVVLHAALVETGVNGNTNVVRKLVWGPGGQVVNHGWSRGSVESVPIDYTLDVPVVNPNALYLVAFVQDKNSQYIHQTVIVKAPAKEGILPPVGVEDDPQTAAVSGLKIYPNPASQAFYFSLDQVLERSYSWKMIDQRGITVRSGDLNRNLVTTPQRVDVSGLANGIYFIAIQTGEKALVYRKVAVMNGHD